MAHVIGNDPHCIDCIHYREKMEGEKCLYDGICDLPLVINGKKSSKPTHDVRWQGNCYDWQDRDTGLTHFEVMTRIPEAKRTPLEIQMLSRYIQWREDEHGNSED